jgi:hypothetical protein
MKKAMAPKTVSKAARERNEERIPWFRAELFCASGVFLVALLLYCCTLAPTVTPTDSGELILVAHGLGIAHPPGTPLWVILAHLASLVPLGNVAVRINFSSALFAALACAMLTLAVAELMITSAYLPARKKRAQPRKKAEDSGVDRLLVFAPALGAGLLMAFSRTLWFYGTITEVYALNALLILTVFFLMLRWRRLVTQTILSARLYKGAVVTKHDHYLYGAAALFGLALGVHHVTVGLTLPALAVIVYRTQALKFFTSRRLLYSALISIGALIVVYAYLPIAASRSPVINWGNPRSLQEIWWHITGRQYRVFLSFTPNTVGRQFAEFCGMAMREFSPAWLPLTLVLALAGTVSAYRQDRTVFWFLFLIVVSNLAYDLSYQIAEDKDAYYLPVFISIAIAAGFGLRWLIQISNYKPSRAYSVAAIAVLLTSAIAFTANWPFNNRRHYFIAHDYVENLLSAIEPNGLLLTQDWQVISPTFYVQELEQHRRDVKVVDVNLLRRSWYFDYLRHAHPGLMERSREKIEAFVDDLKAWERDPAAFKQSDALTQKINTSFLEMIQSMVTNESRVGPVYTTRDLLLPDTTNGAVTQWLTQSYQLVPQGLVFNLTNDSSFHDSPDVRLETRGLADGTVRFEKDDVVNLKILPAYTSMLVNRGRYLASFNQRERAIVAFKEALALNPELAAAREGLAQSEAKLHKP